MVIIEMIINLHNTEGLQCLRMKNDFPTYILTYINSINFSVTVESRTLEEKNSTAHRLYYLYDSESTENDLTNLLVAVFIIGILLLVLALIFIWNAVTYGIVLWCARKSDDYCLCTKVVKEEMRSLLNDEIDIDIKFDNQTRIQIPALSTSK
jgi:hypothetical protein